MKKKQNHKERGGQAHFAAAKTGDLNFSGLNEKKGTQNAKHRTGGKPRVMMSEYYF